MKRNTLTALTLGAVLGLTATSGVALAQNSGPREGGKGHGGMGAQIFEQIDTDGSGSVSREEFETFAMARFDAVDTDGSGDVSKEELVAHRPQFGEGKGFGKRMGRVSDERRAQFAEKLVEVKDQNGDGLLSPEELAARPDGGDIFDKLDANGDGAISKEEFEAMRDQFAGRRGGLGKQ